jgi:hypothetical protein
MTVGARCGGHYNERQWRACARQTGCAGRGQGGWRRLGERVVRGGFVHMLLVRTDERGAVVAGQWCGAAAADARGTSAWERPTAPQKGVHGQATGQGQPGAMGGLSG